ncbi:Required for excision 1-B domain-containing protein [Arabidopsis suecica]|uniref:Required for excision 1-B domain-containing protein n=1 Tax=Arabidopsis suecica TaxID=45249 RepID=A0A8T1Z5C7_ARASU|nr:Required for excision 1-B domain-containing protein [Arabidopsis suecica]
MGSKQVSKSRIAGFSKLKAAESPQASVSIYRKDRIFRPTTTTRHVYDVAAQHVVKVLWEGSMLLLRSIWLLDLTNLTKMRLLTTTRKLKSGFSEYVESGAEPLYQTLCSEITTEFSECSKQVREMESQFLNPQVGRSDLAKLLSDIQTQEKQKLHLTVTIHRC